MVNLELNIFKLKDSTNVEDVISKINEVASSKLEFRKFEKTVELENEAYNLEFVFYMNENPSATVEWYQDISMLFENQETIRKKVYSGYGVLLIHNTKVKFVSVFGRAIHLLAEYIDWDFGLNMATKMLDKNSIAAQSSKFFSTSKNKSLVVYNKGKFNAEAGESVDLINATISECEGHKSINEICNYIRRNIGFSSGIKVVVSMEKIRIQDIVKVISLLNLIDRKYTPRVFIPRLNYLKSDDPLNLKLLEKLNDEILSGEDINVSLDLYTVINSKITLFENISEYRLSYKRKNKMYSSLSIVDIREFMQEYEIENIEDVKLRVFFDGTGQDLKILKIIDYTTELDEMDSYFCLYDGRWAEFNIDYVNRVNNDIEILNKECVIFDESYNLSIGELEKIKMSEGKEILEISGYENVDKLYPELIYNYKISKEKSGILLDRKTFENIEICDVYADAELIHTKIGSPGDFNECINQSLNGFELWNFKKEGVKEALNINNVETVTMILIIKNKSVWREKNISCFNSLRFKLNLINWKKEIETTYGKKAKIIIANYEE